MLDQQAAQSLLDLLEEAAKAAGLDLATALGSDAGASAFCVKLKEKCSSGVNHPVRGGAFRQLQTRLPDISAAITDAANRAQLDALYRAKSETDRAEQHEALRSALMHLKEIDKELDSRTLEAICKEFVNGPGCLLTENDVHTMAAELGIGGGSEFTEEVPAGAEVPLLLAADLAKLDASLKILGDQNGESFENLYAFLKVGSAAPDSEVLAAVKALEEWWRPKGASNAKTAAQEAISRAKTWLIGDQRRRYDLSLAHAVLGQKGLWRVLGIAGADQVLDAAEYDDLVKRGVAAGIGPEDVEAMIHQETARRGIRIRRSTRPAVAPAATRRCGYCGRVSEKSARACSNPACGRSLDVHCIDCSTTYATSDGMCPKCRLTLSAQMQIEDARVRVATALGGGDLDAAREIASQLVARHPGSARAKEIHAEVKQASEAIEHELSEVHSLVDRKMLFQAGQLLEMAATKRRLSPERVRQLDYIHKEIARAEKLLAAVPDGAPDDELHDALEAACGICVDSPTIRARAARFKPLPPKMVSAEPGEGLVALKWSASESSGVSTYRVLRKLDSAPADVADAEEIARVGATRFEDSTVPVGRRVYYAVVAERLGVLSAPLISAPVVRTAPVVDLRVVAGDRWVRANWELPEGARGVVVTRTIDGESTAPSPVTSGRLGFTDSGLENGVAYRYQVYPEFDVAGSVKRGPVCATVVTPKSPPAPPANASISTSGMIVTVRYDAPPGATVALARTREKPPYSEGQVISADEFEALGHVVRTASVGTTTDTLHEGGVFYYTLAVLDVPQAVIGPTVKAVALADCTDLNVAVAKYFGELKWTWPDQCKSVMVTVSSGKPADTPQSPCEVSFPIVRTDLRDSMLGFKVAGAGEYFVRVFAGYETDHGLEYAPGTAPGCNARVMVGDRGTVTYAFVRTMLGRYQLKITGSRRTLVPESVLVAKQGFGPIGPSDGSVVMTLPPFELETGTAKFDVPNPPRGHCVKLFLADPASYEHFHVDHPNAKTLKVK